MIIWCIMYIDFKIYKHFLRQDTKGKKSPPYHDHPASLRRRLLKAYCCSLYLQLLLHSSCCHIDIASSRRIRRQAWSQILMLLFHALYAALLGCVWWRRDWVLLKTKLCSLSPTLKLCCSCMTHILLMLIKSGNWYDTKWHLKVIWNKQGRVESIPSSFWASNYFWARASFQFLLDNVAAPSNRFE